MEKYFDAIVNTISKLITFDSSLAPAEGDMPFGKPTRDCLDCFLSLADSFGFETHNYDNYAGEVIFGEGEELAILAHLDVVPAGDGWNHDPFGGEIDLINQKIWGRGAMDDKGPAVICLYCLKALKDEGFVPKKKIKLIVGCNEESGWACLAHYNKVAHMPEIGFSPDADFPVIYAEKGIAHVVLHYPVQNPPFLSLEGGTAANMVCAHCTATLTDGTKKETFGKSAHGSTPEAGVNAILLMLEQFAEHPDVKKILDELFYDVKGLKQMHDETGYLTASPDIISFDGATAHITVDIRFPATHTEEEVKAVLSSFGVPYDMGHVQAPLYNDKNSFLIKTLRNVYNRETGEDHEPIAIGGGTYARALKCGAGFGPEQEGEEQTIHQANEYITFEKIRFCSKIYYAAIQELTKA